MCGIAGVGHISPEVWPDTLQGLGRAVQALRKRGPDGVALLTEPGFALAQTYLSITDREGGVTPYISADRRFMAVVNGQVYNHEELRDDARLRSLPLVSKSDCEIIANGFAAYGPAFFDKIRGMFAIAILDRLEHTLILARDRFGIRPLYYAETAGRVVFCSEPAVLAETGLASAEADEESVFDALALRSPIEPKTMFQKIKAVPPGTCLTFAGAGCHAARFTEDPFAPGGAFPGWADAASAGAQVRRRLEQSVAVRIPDSCRYGTFLSGGLDSGIVAALAPKGDENRIASLACGFEAAGMPDERAGARGLAARLETPLRETSLGPEAFLATWPYMMRAYGGPLMFNSAIPIHWMCRMARDAGGKTMLSGEGADEVFLGYSRYRAYAGREDDGSPEFLIEADNELVHLARLGGQSLAKNPATARLWRSLATRIDETAPSIAGQSGLERKLRFDRATFLRALLMRQDRAGLGAAIEIRVPFLDAAVVAPARSVAADAHLDPVGKQVLRAQFGDVLGPFSATPKIGFPLPLAAWLDAKPFARITRLCGQAADLDRFLGPNALGRALALARSHPREPAIPAWTLLNHAAWRLWQTMGDAFLGLWRDQLGAEGQALMDALDGEQRGSAPEWLPRLLSRCAAERRGTVSVSVDWAAPTNRQCLEPLPEAVAAASL